MTSTMQTRFNVGDLVEYRNPDTGAAYLGRVVVPYTEGQTSDDKGHFAGWRAGYGCMYQGFGDTTYFAEASALRLLVPSALVAARANPAFQSFKAGMFPCPRQVRATTGVAA